VESDELDGLAVGIAAPVGDFDGFHGGLGGGVGLGNGRDGPEGYCEEGEAGQLTAEVA
jgi:hypothetical protein